jgi:uncharacterized glyoxalase superfamily protein PhnB
MWTEDEQGQTLEANDGNDAFDAGLVATSEGTQCSFFDDLQARRKAIAWFVSGREAGAKVIVPSEKTRQSR